MSPVDLYGEMYQALSHPRSANWIGVDTVRADGDGLYVPDPDGPILAAIVAVMPDDEIIDLVAIDLVQPKRWRRRIGVANLLGEVNLIGLSFTGEPLLVHANPADWLNAGGRGCAVLEFTPSVCGLLRSIRGGLDVDDDPDFAERLERELSEPARRPTIYLRQQRAA
ncbi:MAG: hypothetical protein O7B98_04255 [Alphaproteobacteria bacterium]|nr:hypothetical protein [Alphaproteobacteria bacterium]